MTHEHVFLTIPYQHAFWIICQVPGTNYVVHTGRSPSDVIQFVQDYACNYTMENVKETDVTS